MSKILDRLKSVGDSSGRCHVRVSDNMTYGPVALNTVSQWAEQGRITSESEISFDRKEWARADAIPELELDWTAQNNGDAYGPFNLHALSQLVRRGIVAPDAKVTHRETGETLEVPRALECASESRPLDAAAARLAGNGSPIVAAQSLVSHAASLGSGSAPDVQMPTAQAAKGEAPAKGTATADRGEAKVREALAAAQEDRDRLEQAQQRVAELEKECSKLQGENTGFASELEATVAQQSEAQIALEKRTKEVATLEARLQEASDKLSARVSELESELTEARTTLGERQEEVDLLNQTREAEQGNASDEIQGLKDGLAATTRRLDERETELGAEISGLQSELAETREQAAQREAENGLKVDELSGQVSQLTERLTSTQARLKEEQVDAGTLKSELEIAKQEVMAQEKQLLRLTGEVKARDEKVAGLALQLDTLGEKARNVDEVVSEKTSEISIIQSAMKEREREAEVLKTALAEAEEAHQAREEELTAARAAVLEHTDVSSKAGAEKQQLRAQVAALEKSLCAKDDALNAKANALATREKDVAAKDAELQEARKALAEAEAAMAKGKTAEAADLKAVNTLQDDKTALEETIAAMRAEADDLRAKLEGEHAHVSELTLEMERTRGAMDETNADRDRLQQDMAQLRADLSDRTAQLSDVQAALEEAAAKQDETQVNAEVEELKTKLAEAEAALAKPAPEPEPKPEEPKEWYLRYDGENMLGPVSFDDLLAWTKDCRVAPDHDVSSDKIFWAKASDVSALEMEWMVTLVDGTAYGPINKHAIDDLIADESVTADAELTHCKTGEKLSAQDVQAE